MLQFPQAPFILPGDSNARTMQLRNVLLFNILTDNNATGNLEMSTVQLYGHFAVRVLYEVD
jgi:hypothetical protein